MRCTQPFSFFVLKAPNSGGWSCNEALTGAMGMLVYGSHAPNPSCVYWGCAWLLRVMALDFS